jgi:hypothetical protein
MMEKIVSVTKTNDAITAAAANAARESNTKTAKATPAKERGTS